MEFFCCLLQIQLHHLAVESGDHVGIRRQADRGFLFAFVLQQVQHEPQAFQSCRLLVVGLDDNPGAECRVRASERQSPEAETQCAAILARG